MKKIVVAIPHSHTWFWTQTCLTSIMRCPPVAEGYDVDVVVVDNSPWSPAIQGITDTKIMSCDMSEALNLRVVPNHKSNKFHASALDCVVEKFEFDYLMALETDVMALRPTWLQWFVDQMRPTDYAVGMWHHEHFVNPSCTLYRGDVLREMMDWCRPNILRSIRSKPDMLDMDKETGRYKFGAPKDDLRWGPQFINSQPIAARQPERDYQDWRDDNVSWIEGPFAEKRGWPEGTTLKEQPSGQLKGPGWYEPGQQLHHWAVDRGWDYTVCPFITAEIDGVPVQSFYGSWNEPSEQRQLEAEEMFGKAETVHLWGGTRALDIIKHAVTCGFVKANTPKWLAREARFWRQVVPPDVQAQTLELIRQYGWHLTGQGADHVSSRDKEAAEFVRECYRAGGVEW